MSHQHRPEHSPSPRITPEFLRADHLLRTTEADGSALPHAGTPLVSRRAALRAALVTAGSAALLSRPALAFAEPQASQDTLDALSDAQDQLDAAQSQLNEIAEQYQELSKQQDETISKIEDVEAQIEQAQDNIDQKQQELEAKQEMLSDRVASSYKSGGNEALSLLLSSDSFDQLISNAYYIEKINEQDREAIAEVERIKQELEQQKQDLEDQRAELESLKEQQAEQLTEMQQKQRETQELYDSLDSEVQDLIAQRDAEIAAAIEAEKEAERRRQEALQNQTSTSRPTLPAAGSGQDYDAASPAQRRVVDSCYYTPSPGAGWCAAWVSYVFSNAGFGSVWGNACDMYNSWCTSSNKSDLQVGMIIAVSTHSNTAAGRIYGHVGIYIGDNRVMHNVGPIATAGLDEWIYSYGTTVTPRWGWANGINLANRS